MLAKFQRESPETSAFPRTNGNTPGRFKYHRRMRRLLQFGTSLFLLVMFLAPLAEFFDRWDAPGLSNDTEFGVFALVLALCLVLVVCMLIAARSLRNKLVLGPVVQNPPDEKISFVSKLVVSIFIPPRLTPLRI
jgi:hypothetical protein